MRISSPRPERERPTASLFDPAIDALLSVLVPGLGQLNQRRYLASALQFGTCAFYILAALVFDRTNALWFAALWNAWSANDAYRRAPD
jgi:hypothetical protein